MKLGGGVSAIEEVKFNITANPRDASEAALFAL